MRTISHSSHRPHFHDSLNDSPTSTKPLSIESVLNELSSSEPNVSVIVNTPNWNQIPLLIQDWDGKDETPMLRLLDELSRILTLVSDSDVPLANKRLLHSSLSNLSQSPTLPKKGRLRIAHSLTTLDSVPDGPFTIVETEKFRTMEHALSEVEKRSSEMTERINDLTDRVVQAEEKTRQAEVATRMAEEQKSQAEREKEKLSDEVKRTAKELGEAREGKAKSEREKREMAEKMEQMKQQLTDVPIWVGTESLQTLDRAAHRLTSTTLTQIIKLEKKNDWRTAFTLPIDEGEWEFKIRRNDINWNVNIHSLKMPHTTVVDAISVGLVATSFFGVGGMWQGGQFKPAGTNKKCDRIGQTAAIRVNMSTREARLFVDDEEQPGIFTDIPSPLCLGISTSKSMTDAPVEVLWLKLRRS
ncbi:hypothetical protein BLNAU_19326 [Blattamonas nauphoetae]|uniref:TLDc domain-containing protein n=1 Tax=Blattamonas nauphoetae TaxID=2049346 RepID=A0ABQ9X1W4_9EUKA|nr:hypothetical protein BLNAU_19326 [Blattamonas nauphoetae]